MRIKLGNKIWEVGHRTGIFGILNVTPNSFSDGGAFMNVDLAVSHAKSMFDQGADVVDVGGESTRPGFKAVSESEEIERVIPVIRAINSGVANALISVDTSKAKVAEQALLNGASIVNDVWGFQKDPELAEVVSNYKGSCVLMHNARNGWACDTVLGSIKRFWDDSIGIALKAGVDERGIILDPGIGFTDSREQDLEIMRGLHDLRAYGFPLLIGASRKRIAGDQFGLSVNDRLETTLATTVVSICSGVDFVRVHDVQANARAVAMSDFILRN